MTTGVPPPSEQKGSQRGVLCLTGMRGAVAYLLCNRPRRFSIRIPIAQLTASPLARAGSLLR